MVTAHDRLVFQELFDVNEIQEIQDSFSKATGVASIITDIDGTPITRPSNFCRLCQIIRETEKGRANCLWSDSVIGQFNPDGPVIQPCLSGGLWDAGVSISVEGQHIASWLVGQVKTEATDVKKILEYAKDIRADIHQVKEAVDRITAMPLAQFKNISSALFIIANQLSKQAFQKVRQQNLVAEKRAAQDLLDKQNRELRKKTEYLEALHETSLGMFSRREMSQVLEAIIARACNLTQIPNGFIHIYDADQNLLEIKAAQGLYDRLKGTTLKPGQGLAGTVWESGAPLYTNDYAAWAGHAPQFDFVTAAIGVPLTSGSRVEGVIGLSHHETGKTISKEALKILEQFAELATLAIDNARLFQGLKDELDTRTRLESERLDMEARLRQSQKMEAIGTLAGGIAHDFNNILFPVMGFSQMIMQDLPDTSPMKSQVQAVLDGTERAKNLVQQILTFSRQSEQKSQPLKLELMIKESLKLARASLPSTISITGKIPRDAGMVMADPAQVHQIIMNLITNAMHAMEDQGGTLTVELKKTDGGENKGPAPQVPPGQYLCLEVTDTGCGMDPKTVNRIYEPYFTTKETDKGTGLGLAVVHGIVKTLHGEIMVESTPGKGSCFSVYLPRLPDKEQTDPKKARPLPQLNGSEKILLVDDDPSVLKMVAHLLTRFGYKVQSYDKSLDALARFQSGPREFDLVITDMTMPGMTGDQLVSRIKAIRPGIPVILCTGFSEAIVNARTSQTSPDKVLMKPAGKNDILGSIRMLLDA